MKPHLRMSISSGLQLSDLNDYLQPSTACVIPTDNQVSLSLDDCLACSGCITSAESMLVTMQTGDELLEKLPLYDERYCILSTQSVLAIAKHFNLDVQDTWSKLRTFINIHLKSMVKDINEGRMLSLVKTAEELVDKMNQNQTNSKELPKSKQSDEQLKQHFESINIPMFVTACPGWVCYVEKTHPFLLPLLSKTKSPQQLSGLLCKSRSKDSNRAFTFAVMPCYDKKLEAARYVHSFENVKDVDLVITTAELLKLIYSKQVDFLSLPNAQVTLLKRTIGAGSGGYSEFVFLYVLNKVYNIPITHLQESTTFNQYQIQVIEKRGKDLREFQLLENNNIVFKTVAAFGFRHIQNIVRTIKRKGTSDAHFYEVMACPGGCLNGGGQINIVGEKTKLSPLESKAWIKEMVLKYDEMLSTDIIEPKITFQLDRLHTEFMTIKERESTAVNVVNSW